MLVHLFIHYCHRNSNKVGKRRWDVRWERKKCAKSLFWWITIYWIIHSNASQQLSTKHRQEKERMKYTENKQTWTLNNEHWTSDQICKQTVCIANVSSWRTKTFIRMIAWVFVSDPYSNVDLQSRRSSFGIRTFSLSLRQSSSSSSVCSMFNFVIIQQQLNGNGNVNCSSVHGMVFDEQLENHFFSFW